MRKLFYLLIVTFICSGIYSQKAFLADDFLKGHRLYYVQDSQDGEVIEYYLLSEIITGDVVLEYGTSSISTPRVKDIARTISYKNIKDINIRLTGDINFDGIEDIVIDDPEILDEGCYIPLKNSNLFISQNGKYVYSADISSLYNGAYCLRGGSFTVATDKEQIITSASGGAALHSFAVYEIDGIHTKKVGEFVEDGFKNPVFLEITGKQLVDDVWKDIDLKIVPEECLEKVLSFDTKNGKGSILLFLHDNILYYAFKQSDGYISFAHPSHPDKADKATFTLSEESDGYELEFKSGTIKYTIYETENLIGITIDVNGKITDWSGNLSSKVGDLKRLEGEKIKNIIK